MNYTATDVKNLRDSTGAGLLDCKKLLMKLTVTLLLQKNSLKKKVLLQWQTEQTVLQPKDESL